MGRYEKLGEFLAENGVLMFGHDHGRYAVCNVFKSIWHSSVKLIVCVVVMSVGHYKVCL